MSMDQRQRKLVVAILHEVGRLSDEEWIELSILTNGEDIVRNYRRIDWPDVLDPTAHCVSTKAVITSLIEQDPANLNIIIDYLNLDELLKERDPKQFAELFGHTQLLLDELKDKAITNSFDLNQYILRIQDVIDSDPELAIGSMKDLLESVMKCILEAHGESVGKEDLQTLLNRTKKILKLDPSGFDETMKGAKIIKRTLSNLGQVVKGIDELRNLYGTGHGRTRRSGVTPRHARLVINAGAALAVFLIETFEHHQKDS